MDCTLSMAGTSLLDRILNISCKCGCPGKILLDHTIPFREQGNVTLAKVFLLA